MKNSYIIFLGMALLLVGVVLFKPHRKELKPKPAPPRHSNLAKNSQVTKRTELQKGKKIATRGIASVDSSSEKIETFLTQISRDSEPDFYTNASGKMFKSTDLKIRLESPLIASLLQLNLQMGQKIFENYEPQSTLQLNKTLASGRIQTFEFLQFEKDQSGKNIEVFEAWIRYQVDAKTQEVIHIHHQLKDIGPGWDTNYSHDLEKIRRVAAQHSQIDQAHVDVNSTVVLYSEADRAILVYKVTVHAEHLTKLLLIKADSFEVAREIPLAYD